MPLLLSSIDLFCLRWLDCFAHLSDLLASLSLVLVSLSESLELVPELEAEDEEDVPEDEEEREDDDDDEEEDLESPEREVFETLLDRLLLCRWCWRGDIRGGELVAGVSLSKLWPTDPTEVRELSRDER